jgi:cytochrome c oxidase subunit 4
MSDHIVSAKVYVAVFLALVVLTGITVGAATFDFGPLNVIVALGIAITKATLVVLYFMHARYAGGLTGLVILSSVAFFFILVFLTMSDYVTRSWSLVAAS